MTNEPDIADNAHDLHCDDDDVDGGDRDDDNDENLSKMFGANCL